MNYLIAIINEDKNLFSGLKTSSPKMINQMKQLCILYKVVFNKNYKIARFINTKKGMKQV
jgi:hypothetical protein